MGVSVFPDLPKLSYESVTGEITNLCVICDNSLPQVDVNHKPEGRAHETEGKSNLEQGR